MMHLVTLREITQTNVYTHTHTHTHTHAHTRTHTHTHTHADKNILKRTEQVRKVVAVTITRHDRKVDCALKTLSNYNAGTECMKHLSSCKMYK